VETEVSQKEVSPDKKRRERRFKARHRKEKKNKLGRTRGAHPSTNPTAQHQNGGALAKVQEMGSKPPRGPATASQQDQEELPTRGKRFSRNQLRPGAKTFFERKSGHRKKPAEERGTSVGKKFREMPLSGGYITGAIAFAGFAWGG